MRAQHREIKARILDSIAAYQRKNLYIAVPRNKALTIPESHLLLLIEGNPHRSIGDYREWLNVPKATMTRTVESIRIKGLVSVSSKARDRRNKHLSLTKKAFALLRARHAESNRFVRERLRALNPSACKRLRRLLEKFCDLVANWAGFVAPRRLKSIRCLLDKGTIWKAWTTGVYAMNRA